MFDPIIFKCPISEEERRAVSARIVNQATLTNYRAGAHVVKELYTGWYVTHAATGNSTLTKTLKDNYNTREPQKFHDKQVVNSDSPEYNDSTGLVSEIGFLPYRKENQEIVYLPVLSIEKADKDDYYYQSKKIFFKVVHDKLKVKVKDGDDEETFFLSLADFPDWDKSASESAEKFSDKFSQLKQEVKDARKWVDIGDLRNGGCLKQTDTGNALYYSIIERVKFQTGSKVAYLIEDFPCNDKQKVDFNQLKNHIATKKYGQDLYEKSDNKMGFISLEEESFNPDTEPAYFVANFPQNATNVDIRDTFDKWLFSKAFTLGGLSRGAPRTENGYEGYGFVAVYKGGRFCKNIVFRKDPLSGEHRLIDITGKNNVLADSIQSVIPDIPDNDVKGRASFIRKIPHSGDKRERVVKYIDKRYKQKPGNVSMVSLADTSQEGVEKFIRDNGYVWGHNLGNGGMLVVYNSREPNAAPKIYNYARDTPFELGLFGSFPFIIKYNKKESRWIRCNEAKDYDDFRYLHYRKKRVEPLLEGIKGEDLTEGKLYSLRKAKPWYKTWTGWLAFLGVMVLGAAVGALVAFFAPEIIAALAFGALATVATIAAGAIIGAVYFGASFLIGALLGAGVAKAWNWIRGKSTQQDSIKANSENENTQAHINEEIKAHRANSDSPSLQSNVSSNDVKIRTSIDVKITDNSPPHKDSHFGKASNLYHDSDGQSNTHVKDSPTKEGDVINPTND